MFAEGPEVSRLLEKPVREGGDNLPDCLNDNIFDINLRYQPAHLPRFLELGSPAYIQWHAACQNHNDPVARYAPQVGHSMLELDIPVRLHRYDTSTNSMDTLFAKAKISKTK